MKDFPNACLTKILSISSTIISDAEYSFIYLNASRTPKVSTMSESCGESNRVDQTLMKFP